MDEVPDQLTPVTIVPEDLSRELFLSRIPRNDEKRPVLGGITLVRKLGRGGMGAVYFGIHPRLNCPVAVKVLSLDLVEQDPSLAQRFLGEARMAAGLKSPHVVQMYDVNVEHDTHFFVMEYIDGDSAGTYLKRVRAAGKPGVDEQQAVEIMKAAARGLVDAHRAGIIHRDIKPDNLLIPRVGTALDFSRTKILDLGLAKPAGTSSSLGTLANVAMGTPGFMAPEQARDARTAGKPADVFSMGATLYALLSGRSPFGGSSVMTTLADTETKPHQPLAQFRPDISASVRAIVDRCLAKDPAQRYPDATALLDALNNLGSVGESTLPAVHILPPESQIAPARGKATLIATLVVVAVAVSVGAYFMMGGTTKATPPAEQLAKIRSEAKRDLNGAVKQLDEFIIEQADTPFEAEARKLRENYRRMMSEQAKLRALIQTALKSEKEGRIADALNAITLAAEINRADAEVMEILPRIEMAARNAKSSDERREEVRRILAEADAVRVTAGTDPEAWQKVTTLASKAAVYADGDDKALAAKFIAEALHKRSLILARKAEKEGNLEQAIEIARLAPELKDYVKSLEELLKGGQTREARKKELLACVARAKDLEKKDPEGALAQWERALSFADGAPDRDQAGAEIKRLAGLLGDRKRDENYRAAMLAAEQALLKEDLEAAELAFRKALEFHPDDVAGGNGLERVHEAKTPRDLELKIRAADDALIQDALTNGPLTLSDANKLFTETYEIYKKKEYAKTIEPFKRIFYQFPDSKTGHMAAYNVSCALALLNDRNKALDWLEISFRHGFSSVDHANDDADFVALKADPRFKDILRRAAMLLRTVEAKRRQEDQPIIAEGLPETVEIARKKFSEAYAMFTTEGRIAEAMSLFKRIFYAFPDESDGSLSAYNVACGYALRGERVAALDWLEIAVLHGLGQQDDRCHGCMTLHAQEDTDLKTLWKDERFERIIMGGVRPFSDAWGGFDPGTWIHLTGLKEGDDIDSTFILSDTEEDKVVLERAHGRQRRQKESPRKAEALGEARVTIGKTVYDCRQESVWFFGEKIQVWTIRDGPESELAAARVMIDGMPFEGKALRRETMEISGRKYPCISVDFEAKKDDKTVRLTFTFCRHVPGGIAKYAADFGEAKWEVKVGALGKPGTCKVLTAAQLCQKVEDRVLAAKTIAWKSTRAMVDTVDGEDIEYTVEGTGAIKEGNKVAWTQLHTQGDEKTTDSLTCDGAFMKTEGGEREAAPKDLAERCRLLLARLGSAFEYLSATSDEGATAAAMRDSFFISKVETDEEMVDGVTVLVLRYTLAFNDTEAEMTLWVNDATWTPVKRAFRIDGDGDVTTMTETYKDWKFDGEIEESRFVVAEK